MLKRIALAAARTTSKAVDLTEDTAIKATNYLVGDGNGTHGLLQEMQIEYHLAKHTDHKPVRKYTLDRKELDKEIRKRLKAINS